MTCKKGDVVLVPFPFSDADTKKKRPAVIIQSNPLNRRLDTVILAQVTSNILRANKEKSQLLVDVDTAEGHGTGLLMNSAVKCETIATLSSGKVLRKIGMLKGSLREKLDNSLRSVLDL